MPLYLLFFINILSFLMGVVFASWQISWLIIFISAAILFGALIFEKIDFKIALLCTVTLLAGAFYYFQYNLSHQNEQNLIKPTPSPIISEIRENLRDSFEKILPNERGDFLFDILFGGIEGLSRTFSKNLDESGARFLVAIDGLHISIIIFIIFSILDFFLPRKLSFLLSFIFIFFFIALTGFSASAIRSSIMAFLAKLAQESGKIYAPANALTLSAFILTLINPKILIFDPGFQLSFLAVLSIIYLTPILKRIMKITLGSYLPSSERDGRTNDSKRFIYLFIDILLISISVQIATAPILISQFHNFSLTSFLTGTLVVIPLPIILILGFFMALLYFISPFLTLILSFIIAPFLEYLIFIINFSAAHAIPFNPEFNALYIVIYYGILLLVILLTTI